MEGQEIIKSDKTMKYAGVAGIVSIVLCILLSSARYFFFTLTPHPDNGYSLVLRFVSQLLSYVQFALLMLPWFFLALSKIKSSWLIWIHLGVSFLYSLAGSFVLSNILRAVAPENYTMVNAMSHSAMNLICTVLLAAVVAGLFIANKGWPRRVLLLLLIASVIGVFACVFHAISLFNMLGHRSSSFAFRIFSFLYEIGYIAASMIRLAGWMMLYFGPSRQAPNEEGGSAGFSDPHVALRWRLYIAAIPWLSALSAMQYGGCLWGCLLLCHCRNTRADIQHCHAACIDGRCRLSAVHPRDNCNHNELQAQYADPDLCSNGNPDSP